MSASNKTSLLVAGVPLNRGMPEHLEHQGEVALTDYSQDGKVTRIVTPQCIVRRIHELMHARFTNQKRAKRQYKNVFRNEVKQIAEDLRIHLFAWPWRGDTPASVKQAVHEFFEKEKLYAASMPEKARQSGATMADAIWPMFATRLRAAALVGGMTGYTHSVLYDLDYSDGERKFAADVIDLVQSGKEGKAAEALEKAFFPPPIEIDLPPQKTKTKTKEKKKRPDKRGGMTCPPLEVIELPHNEAIEQAEIGLRLATSGARLYRPALRRPILPQRIFIKQTIRDPAGVILIDASGSMGSFEIVSKWVKRSPFATVAYYAGNQNGGQLFIYARNGFRSHEMPRPKTRANAVDGKALDWLMSQDGPRVFITDREFCGASDSHLQIMRLDNLEKCGEVTVLDYSENDPDEMESE
jgi:hypothetical protein